MNMLGFPIITSPYLADTERRIVNRPWRERLLTWPWRPWVPHKTISVTVSSKSIYFTNGNGIFRFDGVVAHPSALASTKTQAQKISMVGNTDEL